MCQVAKSGLLGLHGTPQFQQLMCLLCPPECIWCGTPIDMERSFCGECRLLLKSDFYHCLRCATPLPRVVPNTNCFRCRDAGWKFSQVVALGPYRGKLREAVILTKKRSYETLRIGLAELLVEALEAKTDCWSQTPRPQLLIPVPYHWSHTFSHAAPTSNSLAFAIGRQIGVPVETRIVRRTRKTAKQGMLSWTERKQNVRGAFEIRTTDAVKGRHIWLIDDVLTSGATASELANRLLRAGAHEVSVLVIARGTGARDRSQLVNPMEFNVKS